MSYSGNFLYENNELKAIFTSAGRIIPFDNNGNVVYKFEYNLQDHLGNTRVVFSGHSNGQPEVMQVTDYLGDGDGISQPAVILPKLVYEFIFSKIIFFLLLEKGILISFAMPILVSMMSSKGTISEHPILLNTIEFSM